MLRAEKEGFVKMKIEVETDEALEIIDELIIKRKMKPLLIYN